MNKKNKNIIQIVAITFALMLITVTACRKTFYPKPRAYFRIDLPEKAYQVYSSECPYSFEYPVYGIIRNYEGKDAEPCWINIEFPYFKGKMHLTYKPVKKNLALYVEDIRTLAYKHIIKADDIIERPFYYPERKVFGILYDIEGNTASSINFFATDSTRNFLSGSLYFSVHPNADSLSPVIRFFRTDIEHLIETLHWN
jgi:gliding motility-associated lipoprotein GldD